MIGWQENRIARAVREALHHPASVGGAMALVLAAGGAPALAQMGMPIDINGGNHDAVTNDDIIPYLWIRNGAVVNGAVTNSLTGEIVGADGYGGGLRIDNSTVNGDVVNRGTIDHSGYGIRILDSSVGGGIINEGQIQADGGEGGHAIDVDTDSFAGGIVNSGSIDAGDDGIDAYADSFAGGIVNSGSIDAGDDGIDAYADSFAGGIVNSGSIDAGDDGIDAYADSLAGGIVNSGSIDAGYGGIEAYADSFAGGIVNSGSIDSGYTGIGAYAGGFAGGIRNSGSIQADYIGVAGLARDFSGGIANSGEIAGHGFGIVVELFPWWYDEEQQAPSFSGGISNSGSIRIDGWPGEADGGEGGPGTSWGILAFDIPYYYFEESGWQGTFSGGIANSGTIESAGGGIAVLVANFEDGIENSGSIQSAGKGIEVSGMSRDWLDGPSYGTVAEVGAASASDPGWGTFGGGVRNSGSITSGDDAIHVLAQSFDGGIDNSGLINAQGTGIKLGGLDLSAWPRLRTELEGNTSDLPIAGGTFSGGISNSGSIAAAEDGIAVYTERFDGGIQNAGRIQSTGTGIRIGGEGYSVLVPGGEGVTEAPFDGGTFSGGITNSGTIASSAGDGIGVYAAQFDGAIANSGTIDASGVGIRVVSSIPGGIVNTGTIRGGAAAIDTTAATGATVINLNGGAIIGDIDLSPVFADTVNATAGTVQGDILATGPRDDQVNFILNGASFTLNGTIVGVDQVFIDPGTLYLNGTITDVNSVILDADTTLNLGSSATVNTVDYTQDTAATLVYDIGSDGSHGVINTIDATLNGTLEIPVRQRGVLPAPTASTVYSDLMTWTNRTGTFTFEGPDSIFLVGNLIYHPTSLSAEIGRLPFNTVPAGLRGNDYAVATGLENAYPGAYARMDAQSVAFYSPMFDYSVGEYTQFLGTVSGSTYANALQATVFTSQLVNTVVDQRLSGGGGSLGTTSLDAGLPASAPGARTAWAAVLGNWANGDGDTNAPGFDQSTGGFALGLDYRVNAETLVGALAGYLSDRIDFDNNSSSDVDTWQLGAYGQYDTERWYANGLLTVGWNSYDAKRRIAFGNVSETTKGSYDGTTFVLYGEGGYKVPLGDWTVKPMLGLGYVNGNTDSFTEGGSSLYRLRVKGASGESFTSNLGVRASLERETAGGIPITGQVRAVWQHEFLDDQQQVDASFAVLPGSRFTVDGSRYARDSAVLGLGVKAEVAAGTDVFVSYDAKIGSDYTSNALFAGIRKTW